MTESKQFSLLCSYFSPDFFGNNFNEKVFTYNMISEYRFIKIIAKEMTIQFLKTPDEFKCQVLQFNINTFPYYCSHLFRYFSKKLIITCRILNYLKNISIFRSL